MSQTLYPNAPIAIFAYNRRDRLAAMIEILAACDGFGESAVTIFVDALEKLAELDPEASEVFNLRVFAGLKSQEIAEMLNRAVRTVQLAYKRAQVILAGEIEWRVDP